jgi:hypothetical protein
MVEIAMVEKMAKIAQVMVEMTLLVLEVASVVVLEVENMLHF